MKYNKYHNKNKIIHEIDIYGLNDLENTLLNKDIIKNVTEYNDELIDYFKIKYLELDKKNLNINMRYQKVYKNYGNNPKLNRVLCQNINCFKGNKKDNIVRIYYDLIDKYNCDNDIVFNRFILTYNLIKKLKKNGYVVEFIPILFLKAYDKSENNEFVYIKLYDLSVDDVLKNNFILNKDIARILLPEIIKCLDIEDKKALDYSGYLLERNEKENIMNLSNNDVLIDLFTSENLFDGKLIHDANVFYKKLSLKNN